MGETGCDLTESAVSCSVGSSLVIETCGWPVVSSFTNSHVNHMHPPILSIYGVVLLKDRPLGEIAVGTASAKRTVQCPIAKPINLPKSRQPRSPFLKQTERGSQ